MHCLDLSHCGFRVHSPDIEICHTSTCAELRIGVHRLHLLLQENKVEAERVLIAESKTLQLAENILGQILVSSELAACEPLNQIFPIAHCHSGAALPVQTVPHIPQHVLFVISDSTEKLPHMLPCPVLEMPWQIFLCSRDRPVANNPCC